MIFIIVFTPGSQLLPVLTRKIEIDDVAIRYGDTFDGGIIDIIYVQSVKMISIDELNSLGN